jgi:arginyl-tRNA synthetase
LCSQSRREFQKIYDALDIQLTERGESFYNPYLAAVVKDLAATGLLQTDQGAECVFLEGFTNKNGDPQPLIVQKSDGGYNYATTDLAALRYRIQEDKADWIIYVTDAGQANHFAQVFQVARRAGWLPETVKITHVPFGLVQGEDGKKLKTRSGDTVRLQELLDEAIQKFGAILEARLVAETRSLPDGYKAEVARVVGLSAVKYADLSQNRTSNYIFSYDKMLAEKGNTAPYMLYAYARTEGIRFDGNIDATSSEFTETLSRGELRFPNTRDKPLDLREESELTLAKHLLQFEEVLHAVSEDLLPNRLCQYLFELSQKFNQFYELCPVSNAPLDLRPTRVNLCELTALTLKLGLSLLGIKVLNYM